VRKRPWLYSLNPPLCVPIHSEPAAPAANPWTESSGSPSRVVNTVPRRLGTGAARCWRPPIRFPPVLQYGVHIRFPGAFKNGDAAAAIDAREASVGADPNTPRIHQQRTGTAAGQAWNTNLLEAALAVAHQPVAPRADPQRSIRRRQQSGERAAL